MIDPELKKELEEMERSIVNKIDDSLIVLFCAALGIVAFLLIFHK